MELKGKVALVTGAGRGIGKDISLNLAKEGCKVVLVSRTKKQLEEVKREIIQNRGTAIVIARDLAKKENISFVVNKTIAEFRTIDILINNAAISYSVDFFDITEKQWDMTMDINLKAPFLLSQKVLRIMKSQGSGYIINISSTATLEVPPDIAAYGISKLGIVGLSQATYEVGKKFGVKVSVIYPGMTDTEMLRGLAPPVDPEKWMLPEDISGCVLFLLKQSDRVVVKEVIPWARKHDEI